MYLSYWKLREEPFRNTPDCRFLYRSKNHENSLRTLLYGLTSEKGAAMLTGEYGCGKTILVRAILNELAPEHYQIALINYPFFDRDSFLTEICFQFEDEAPDRTRAESFRAISRLFYENLALGKRNILIIDEAQIIEDPQVFEELRLLLNLQLEDRFLVNLLLVGQPELREAVMSYPQLEQRIAIKCHLHRFDQEHSAKYLAHRLKVAGCERALFTENVLYQIHRISNGVPRRINNIADLCLLEGANRGVKEVGEDILRVLV